MKFLALLISFFFLNITFLRAYNLVDIQTINPNIILDIRYATSNNFMGLPMYSQAKCYLHPNVALALSNVQKELESMKLGLKIWDGYRPLSVQQAMWDRIQDERYVANPAKNKGRHTRGTAVDVTLLNSFGEELLMPTEFDDFTEKAHQDCMEHSPEAIKNREFLKTIMQKHGFYPVKSEWWHFDFEGWKDDIKYPPLDVPFEELTFEG